MAERTMEHEQIIQWYSVQRNANGGFAIHFVARMGEVRFEDY